MKSRLKGLFIMPQFQKIQYSNLNAKQQERFNFQQVSAILAVYGFATVLLDDDWNGADFIAIHINGRDILRVQLKGRCGIWSKYQNKDIWICFPVKTAQCTAWYLYPHDSLINHIQQHNSTRLQSSSWQQRGHYHSKNIPKQWATFMAQYML